MENPVEEITNIVKCLCVSRSPDVQKATIEKYFTRDAGFQHPICIVARGPESRDKILGIYQWYRSMARRVSLDVNEIVYNRETHKLYLTITQTTPLFFNPFKSKPGTLITVFNLTPHKPYQITYQTDFYQPEQMLFLGFPILAQFVILMKYFGTIMCGFSASIGQMIFGVWKPSSQSATSMVNGHENDWHALFNGETNRKHF